MPAGFAVYVSNGVWQLQPHLHHLNLKLLDVAKGRCPRLIINMPPRHGKSELVSKHFPAWYLGTYPRKKIILASYEATFAQTWGRAARDLLDEYGQEIFGVGVNQNTRAAGYWMTTEGGHMWSVGVGGAVTGKGTDLLIIDDPVKNDQEANSPTYREKTWNWYRATARTRLQPGGAIIIIQTRWHCDDLTGRLLHETA